MLIAKKSENIQKCGQILEDERRSTKAIDREYPNISATYSTMILKRAKKLKPNRTDMNIPAAMSSPTVHGRYSGYRGDQRASAILPHIALRPFQAIGSPIVGQSGEAREPPGKRQPSKSRTSGIGPPSTRAGGVGKEKLRTRQMAQAASDTRARALSVVYGEKRTCTSQDKRKAQAQSEPINIKAPVCKCARLGFAHHKTHT